MMLSKRSHHTDYSTKYQLMHDILKKQAEDFPVMQTMLILHKDNFIHEDVHNTMVVHIGRSICRVYVLILDVVLTECR